MRWARSTLLLAALAASPGCAEVQFLAQGYKQVSGSADGPVGGGRYVVGQAWRAGTVWYYPTEDFSLNATGLAVRYDGPARPGRLGARTTANGEPFDPARLTAAHQTLQLPAIARVTNLETGRGVVVRINDRGPADPGRMLALSPAAAAAIGVAGGRPTPVRLQVLEAESRRLADALRAEERHVQLAAAPPAVPSRGVAAEALAPPPGTRAAVAVASAPAPVTPVPAPQVAERPLQPVGSRSQEPVRARGLSVQAGTFADPRNATRVAERLSGIAPGRVRAEPVTVGGRWMTRVRIGPLNSTVEADRVLAQARAAGAADARIVVE